MKTLLKDKAENSVRIENIFPAIANERGSVWLDSALMIADKGRFSFMARNPIAEISATSENIESALKELETHCRRNNLFAVGFLSYETGVRFLEVGYKQDSNFPLLHFFLYKSALKFDHMTGAVESTNPEADNYDDLPPIDIKTTNLFFDDSPELSETVSKESYLRKVKKIKEHIKEGDIYQANYTCRFDLISKSEPFAVYNRLRKLNPAPYAAYMNFGDYQIISSSPERLFLKNGNSITSCPIKGTVPSGSNEFESRQQAEKLLASEKDKAELLMIVDLMRNDIGKIAETGTVEVSNLFTPETYSSVIHLVADVNAKLKKEISLTDIFSALVPGGSITGTPKKRAVEILQTYETTPRNVYTGCIGYLNGDEADFNIAIRTILHRNNSFQIHAGGGIVADSDPDSEYNEMQLKARNLFRALGVNESILHA